ncbi:hypothetical protein CEP54_010429 [Fusarium duplospermum]|uniref:Uncharacterized protein n=1 Tax=Fusarium duplospermum TaxID=1325734 RepID=A0A428PK44_9HYPO|nr:hypothetical protein CEP54_010429 [Fusarium duplospermum]
MLLTMSRVLGHGHVLSSTSSAFASYLQLFFRPKTAGSLIQHLIGTKNSLPAPGNGPRKTSGPTSRIQGIRVRLERF